MCSAKVKNSADISRLQRLIIRKNMQIFLRNLTALEIIDIALLVLAITITEFYYCTRKFLAWNLSWEGSCLKSNGVGDTWWRIRYFWAIFLPNGMFVIYVTIFYSIRRKHRFATDINRSQSGTIVTKTNDYEWSMLIQAAWSYGARNIVKQYLCHLFHLVAANSKNKVILIGVRTGAVR
ncbi:Nitrate transporter 2.2 [Dirofilaria immitis]